MRFMLLQDYGGVESDCPPMAQWTPEEIKAHIDFQNTLNAELLERGELIEAQGLSVPERAKFVVSDGVSAPVITDGPYPESKELLAGYRMVDVETLDRARRDEGPRRGQFLAAAAGVVAPVGVGHPARGHPDKPGERVVGLAVGGPGRGGGKQRLLHGVLGVGEVAVAADDRAEGPRRQFAQQALGGRAGGHTSGSGALITSRTSMRWRMGAPLIPGAADARAAISRARSSVSTSTIR